MLSQTQGVVGDAGAGHGLGRKCGPRPLPHSEVRLAEMKESGGQDRGILRIQLYPGRKERIGYVTAYMRRLRGHAALNQQDGDGSSPAVDGDIRHGDGVPVVTIASGVYEHIAGRDGRDGLRLQLLPVFSSGRSPACWQRS